MNPERQGYFNSKVSEISEDAQRIKADWPRWKDTVYSTSYGVFGVGAIWATQGIDATSTAPLAEALRSNEVFAIEASCAIGGFAAGIVRFCQASHINPISSVWQRAWRTR